VKPHSAPLGQISDPYMFRAAQPGGPDGRRKGLPPSRMRRDTGRAMSQENVEFSKSPARAPKEAVVSVWHRASSWSTLDL
jgi:hypothetical protein